MDESPCMAFFYALHPTDSGEAVSPTFASPRWLFPIVEDDRLNNKKRNEEDERK
ncbi:hypothetical protein [Caproiciproducens galactitolivorans]|uniref:Uncharacterized protein n=1 Tax=Caproiciproducens galactitolivorans TaxID=642589 RepID=A0ABT4BXT5_9FIRM|nr:hypothetical protein [Caproiciproducens galactitolivorans]MCY1715135.1 hypothetical protein [Caproiciproducens galactitolivorans]